MKAIEQEVIRRRPEPDQTRSPQVVSRPSNLLIGTAELRDGVGSLHEDAAALHEDVQSGELDRRASLHAQSSPTDLLDVIRSEYGLSWETLAHMLGISSAAIRKWRRGATISAENRHRVGRVVAFCELLHEVNPLIDDPAQWLEEPFLDGYSVTAADLYAAELSSRLLSVAADRTARSALLDEFESDWRERYARDTAWKVETAADGLPVIMRRE